MDKLIKKMYRKRPVVIEAHKVTTGAQWLLEEWCGGEIVRNGHNFAYIAIKTLEGTMKATIGDFIIKGVQGEFYPCKPDIFEQTYEKVEA